MSPIQKLFSNAGYNNDEIEEMTQYLLSNPKLILDIENNEYVDPIKNGILDATGALTSALTNSISIASTLGTIGGLIATPRDHEYERQEASKEAYEQSQIDAGTREREESYRE